MLVLAHNLCSTACERHEADARKMQSTHLACQQQAAVDRREKWRHSGLKHYRTWRTIYLEYILNVCMCVYYANTPKNWASICGKTLVFQYKLGRTWREICKNENIDLSLFVIFLRKKQEYYFSKLYEFISLAYSQLHHKLAFILYRRPVYMISYKK